MTMVEKLRHFLWLNKVEPVTHLDVEPAKPEPVQAKEVRKAQARLIGELMGVERRSVEIRRELANNVISLIAGDSNDHSPPR